MEKIKLYFKDHKNITFSQIEKDVLSNSVMAVYLPDGLQINIGLDYEGYTLELFKHDTLLKYEYNSLSTNEVYNTFKKWGL